MARYIDADLFLKNETKRCGSVPFIGTCTTDNESLVYRLTKAPEEDVVEVVRCNDCIHNAGGWCVLHDACFDKDFYCCFGFRREGEKDEDFC